MLQYTINHTENPAPLDAAWESPMWQRADEAAIANFHAAGSDHRPDVKARVLYDRRALYLRFRVQDRYVISTHTAYQDPVCRDSTVEFFVQPRRPGGYFNFEVNCGGTLLLYFIEDWTRTADGFVRYTRVPAEHGSRIKVCHTMPQVVEPEMPGPVEWQVGYAIPLDVLEVYLGPLGDLAGQIWHGNFFKCADDCSHPHWGSWSPIGEKLNFHQPEYFGLLRFAAE